MNKLIVNFTPTGMVPISVDEIVDDVLGCAALGSTVSTTDHQNLLASIRLRIDQAVHDLGQLFARNSLFKLSSDRQP